MSIEAPQIAVVGGGPMARSIGRILGKTKAKVTLYARRPEAREKLRSEVEGVEIAIDLKSTVAGAEIVFLAVPADAMLEAANAYGEYATADQIVLTATRGVGDGFTLPHELIRARTCVRKIGVLGGPLHAKELTSGRQINLVLASRFTEVIEAVRNLIKGAPLALSPSKDVVGVEVAGAIANVGSIAVGMAEGLELSETARGVLLTHSLADAKRLGLALGAEDATFAGLAGIGELIPRQVTSMDRHRELGRRLAKGDSVGTALAGVEGHVEGIKTAAEGTKKAAALGIKAPLISAVASVLEAKALPKEALEVVLRLGLELEGKASRASA